MITDPIARAAARRFIGGCTLWALVGVAALFLFSLAVTTAVATFAGPIEVSGWGEVSLPLKWGFLAFGAVMAVVTLPQHVAHGRTRREFAVHQAVCVVAMALVTGIAAASAFALESLVYRVMDWPQEVSRTGLYTEADQYALVALEHWLVLPTWIGVGVFVSLGFYRHIALGAALIPVGAVLVHVVEAAVKSVDFSAPYLAEPLAALGVGSGPGVMVASCLVGFLLAMVVTWAVVRDIPLRSRTH
ncbi:hypothetical protein [Halostreptopolyspora alba]|uniref:Uncharacterized protein n=1 Tax=Halostreptopolyspora alba TaxID=2487137 RepID=A0A3N0E3R7_9ACTN|nr:hypothetical protein EFW17_19155 [Nocardiopsaceae bacterium YIM 96095]